MILPKSSAIDYKSELLRKTIHLCSLSIPIIYYYVTWGTAVKWLVPLTLISLSLDVARRFSAAVSTPLYKYFGFMMREHEMQETNFNLSGATWVFISATLTILIFPKYFAVAGFSILIISDTVAALVGRKFGQHKFLFKSLEGTTAFFISACVVIIFVPKYMGTSVEYFMGFFSACVAALAENISYGWADDNLLIPLSVGGTMWLLFYFFFPEIKLISPLFL